MSTPTPSPFLPPGRRRDRGRHRDRGRGRSARRGRRVLGGLAVVLATPFAIVVLVALLATRIVRDAGHDHSGAAATARDHPHRSGSARGRSAPGSGDAATTPASPALLSLHFNHPPRAALLFDLDSGRVLWAVNPTERLPIASLAKMMTARLIVRSAHAGARVHITHNAVNAAGSKVGVLPVGRYVRLETLLYGLMLPSGNDAAVALAEHVAGSCRASSRA